jgi:peptide/bleomycin uptake transporter
MLREFFCSGPAERLLFAWVGLLIFVGHSAFNAWLKWALNDWYAKFYDALQDVSWSSGGELGSGLATNLTEAWEPVKTEQELSTHMLMKQNEVSDLLARFALLVSPAVLVHPLAKWISSNWRFSWRMALVRAYLAHYDVGQIPVEGSAQRIHEDTQRFEGGIYTCFATVLDSVLTLVVFVPVLLEVGAASRPGGFMNFDGWLVSIAVGAAVGGLAVSVCVGHRLVALEVENQKVEGLLRTKLVVLEEQPASIVGVERGEAEEVAGSGEFTDFGRRAPRPRLTSPAPFFRTNQAELWRNYTSLFANFAVFNTWIAAYDQVMIIVPYALVAPLMFAHDPSQRITLGTLMKVTNAFGKVFGAMAVLSENWSAVNDFRSTIYRLREFERHTYQRRRFDHALLRNSDAPTGEIFVPELLASSGTGVELAEAKSGGP